MPTKWMKPLRKIMAQFDRVVMQEMSGWTEARTPEALMAVEQDVHQAARRLADGITATVMGSSVEDTALEAACVAKATATERFRPNSRRSAKLTFLGGNTHVLHTGCLQPA